MLYAAQSQYRASASGRIAEVTGSQAQLSELDQLARETRDTGQLLEPLADSVLDYTLRRLKPGDYADSQAAQELEKTPCPDDLSQLMDKPSTLPEQNLSASIIGIDSHPQSAAVDQGNDSAAQIPHVSGPWAWNGLAPQPFLRGNEYDWWPLSLDTLQQPILPFDEPYNLNVNM